MKRILRSKAMTWSDAYVELAAGTFFAAVGITFFVLIRRKAARVEMPVPSPTASPPRSGAIRLDVRFFFYLSAVFFALAIAQAAPSPWSLLGVVAAVIALVPVSRTVRSTRAAFKR